MTGNMSLPLLAIACHCLPLLARLASRTVLEAYPQAGQGQVWRGLSAVTIFAVKAGQDGVDQGGWSYAAGSPASILQSLAT